MSRNWAVAAAVIGVGTAMVYPTLLTAVWVVAAITSASGVVVAIRVYETLGHHVPAARATQLRV